MAKILTARAVDAARPDTVRREIPDGGMPGLYLVVQPSGGRSWAVRYRYGGKTKKLTIGKYPTLSLAEARERAAEALKTLDGGVDPAETKRAAVRAQADAVRDDYETVVSEFIERYAKRKNRSWAETERLLRREPLSAWRGWPITSIRRRDVIEVIDGIADRAPITANRTLAAVRKLFSWCVERDILPSSPCAGLRPPARETSRDRVLSDAEVAALWRAAGTIGGPFGPLVKVLILTGQRREEVAQMRWSEVDLDTATWTIPASRAKNSTAHVVPLSPAVVEIIAARPRIAPSSHGGRPVWVFTTTGASPVSGFSRAKSRLDEHMVAVLQGEAGRPRDLPPWRLHDIRRTVATGLASLGVQLPVVEKILNHVSGSFGGVAGVYQRHHFAAEQRDALERWAVHVLGLVDGGGVRATG